MSEVFPEVDGPYCWVHHRILKSVVVRKYGGYLFPHEIVIVSNQNNEGAKETMKGLTIMERLQNVLNYSRTFNQE